MDRVGRTALLLVSWFYLLSLTTGANTRTLEAPFALSSDARSEFSTSFQVFSAGRIVIEGAYLILLRIEASDDKEADSDLEEIKFEIQPPHGIMVPVTKEREVRTFGATDAV